MTITTIGLDLAKNMFQVHGVDERGVTALRKQLQSDQVATFFARHAALARGNSISSFAGTLLPR
jgi:transposase